MITGNTYPDNKKKNPLEQDGEGETSSRLAFAPPSGPPPTYNDLNYAAPQTSMSPHNPYAQSRFAPANQHQGYPTFDDVYGPQVNMNQQHPINPAEGYQHAGYQPQNRSPYPPPYPQQSRGSPFPQGGTYPYPNQTPPFQSPDTSHPYSSSSVYPTRYPSSSSPQAMSASHIDSNAYPSSGPTHSDNQSGVGSAFVRQRPLAAGADSSSLLNPPPPCFQRSPPNQLPYSPFPTATLLGNGNTLDDGFPMLPPPSAVNPHPFTTHDVDQEDWTMFLRNVKAAGALSTTAKIIAEVAPMAASVGLVAGFFVSKVIKSHMRDKKTGPVAELVDHWNHYFFHPRQMVVVLAQGHVCYTGTSEGLPPGMRHKNDYNGSNSSSDSSSSSSSSSDDESAHRGKGKRRRKEKRQRREARKERKDSRRGHRKGSTEKWRILVLYRPFTH